MSLRAVPLTIALAFALAVVFAARRRPRRALHQTRPISRIERQRALCLPVVFPTIARADDFERIPPVVVVVVVVVVVPRLRSFSRVPRARPASRPSPSPRAVPRRLPLRPRPSAIPFAFVSRALFSRPSLARARRAVVAAAAPSFLGRARHRASPRVALARPDAGVAVVGEVQDERAVVVVVERHRDGAARVGVPSRARRRRLSPRDF